MYFLGAAELLSVDILILISHFSPKALICPFSEAISFCRAVCPLEVCFLSIVRR